MSVHKVGGFGRFALGAAVAALVGTGAIVSPQFSELFGSAAWAQEDDGEGGEGKGNQGEGGMGQGGQGEGGQGKGGEGQGQGGPGEDSDGQGPKAGSGGSGGGKPVWAQEGIPVVDLGRLSVARSPDQVFERALAEAVASLTPERIAYYNLSYDEVIAELSLNFDEVVFIDSPLQNLALLEDLLAGGTALTGAGVTTDETLLAAMLLGAASDKTLPISVDTVIAVSTILGTPITDEAELAELALLAETIRIAILAGHG
jgi:hypothetical protein